MRSRNPGPYVMTRFRATVEAHDAFDEAFRFRAIVQLRSSSVFSLPMPPPSE